MILGGANLVERPTALAAVLAARQSPELRMSLPQHPLGLLHHLIAQGGGYALGAADVLAGLELVEALRQALIYLEVRLLGRGRHWRGWVSQAEIGKRLGISVSGVTNRRNRLPLKITSGGRVQVRPTTPRVSRQAAESLAAEILERRDAIQHEGGRVPTSDDVVQVIVYVLAHEGAVPVSVIAEDILQCLSIVVSVRRQLDEFELALLDFGRELGVSNRALGFPLGRKDQHATWKARRRLRNSSTGGRHEVIGYHQSVGDDEATGTATEVDEQSEHQIRGIANDVLTHHDALAKDEDLDEWLRWLREAGVHDKDRPLSAPGLGLLWTVLDDVGAALLAFREGEECLLQLEPKAITALEQLMERGKEIRGRLRRRSALAEPSV